MRIRVRSSGFTLIEVLIAMGIFAIGSLGVLAMVVMTLHLNVNSRQTIEANQLAIRQAERLQILGLADSELTACTMASPCYLQCTGGPPCVLSETATESAVRPSDLLGGAAGSILWYEVVWRVGPASATNPRYMEVKVYWPKNRDLAGTNWSGSGLNCATTSPGNCYSTQIYSYR